MDHDQRRIRRFIISNKKSKKIYLWVILGLVGIYLLVALVFTFITLPNTYINGNNVSYASKESALDQVSDDFTFTISGRNDKELTINSKDIDYDARIPENASIDQNPLAWPVYLAKGKEDQLDFDVSISYDKDKLKAIVEDSALFSNVTNPVDAKLIYEDGEFKIVKEVLGDELDYGRLKEAILKSIYKGHEDITLTDDFYKAPSLLADSEQMNELLEDGKRIEDLSISFNFNGFDIKLEGEDLVEMLDQKDGKFELNYDLVQEFMKEVADKTNTYGKDRRFMATGIGEIVVNPGVYGFILDEELTTDEVYKLFNQRKSGDIEPIYQRYAYERTEDGTDIGDTYIEVDLSRQYLWFYKDGDLIIESNFVSGISQAGWQTNVGVGSILDKVANTTLRGIDFSGGDYETPVDYWMPIGWDGEGFHDAPWRGNSFGGNIYNTNGSHGCINLPPSVARVIFENAEIHTPVIVYESSTNLSPAMMY
ncbi:MAG: peptidoglycan binding domain-containing protein [Anaerococcus sp.]|nr:peptidoglycan binding domain-containing protein [Anaerococcus sp.]